ncbi:hypothetical protein TIFTF001_018634 [Ficus carica]|uniref:Uncharacterized protein n=1 Tax=Ficus carica TaxID=3494 RepID=A0AA88AS54_FICCA|nr:hypothetical protein TIFTF001_018634 [Ficus carica]
MCGARESETYQFHGRGCGRHGSKGGSGGWVLRKRLERGVTAEIGGKREKERGKRE